MQFKVPQFLDIEDKIFGPFTFSEFVYLAGGAGLCFVVYKLLGLLLGLLPIIAIIAFSLALTFYKPNSKPFIFMLEAGVKYAFQDKLFIWRRKVKKVKKTKQNISHEVVEHQINTPRLGHSKLRDLAWSLDVLDLKKESPNN
ncbi:MAG: PrgI family protein [Patescibacteria group bacterium]